MTTPRAWQLPEQHLMPDAVVALVDGELSPTARHRAEAHLAGCPSCSAEAAAQRQARSAIAEAGMPRMSMSLLESLRSIPQSTDIEALADISVGQDGQLYTVQRPDKVRFGDPAGRFGSGPGLGSTAPLGSRVRPWHAGVMVGGLMLGALALVLPVEFGGDTPSTSGPGLGPRGAIDRGAVNAHFGGQPSPPAPAPQAPGPSATGSQPVSTTVTTSVPGVVPSGR